jgi:hypothetical protein
MKYCTDVPCQGGSDNRSVLSRIGNSVTSACRFNLMWIGCNRKRTKSLDISSDMFVHGRDDLFTKLCTQHYLYLNLTNRHDCRPFTPFSHKALAEPLAVRAL